MGGRQLQIYFVKCCDFSNILLFFYINEVKKNTAYVKRIVNLVLRLIAKLSCFKKIH